MVLHLDPRIPESSHFIATQIANLRASNPETTIREAVAAEVRAPVQTVFVPGDDVSSTCCWLRFLDVLMLLCDGIATGGQGVGTWQGYVGGLLGNINAPTNDYFSAAATKILSFLPGGFTVGTNDELFCGWSLGGCEAMAVALAGVNQGFWPLPRIATFGSPRFGNAAQARRFAGARVVRWMNDADPVPNVPPRVADMPILPALYGVSATLRMGNFVHVSGGAVIDSAGRIVDGEIPPLAPSAFPLQIASWLVGSDASQGSPHFIGTYVARLQLWMDAHPNAISPVRIHTPIEETGQSTRNHLSQEQRAAEAALFVNADGQQGGKPAIPPKLRFKAIRVGRLWYLTMNGAVITIAPSKKRCRGLANAGNDFLKRTLREGYVDTDQLTASITSWLQAAQDPTSGITPQLSVTLP